MRKIDCAIRGVVPLRGGDTSTLRVGRIVAINPEGRLFVDFPGNSLGPIEVRFVLGSITGVSTDLPVLVAFDSEDPTLAIILGVLHDSLGSAQDVPDSRPPVEPLREVIVNGRTMVFDASQQITFRCGSSSVVLRKDGKVIIKGENIITRASRTNKIKGAAVMIN